MNFIDDYIIPIATLSPLIIPVSMIIAYLVSINFVWIFFLFLTILNSGINFLLKKIFGKLFYGRDFIRRPISPDDCCSTIVKACNLTNIPGLKGFPSGHSQLAMLFASFFSLYIYSYYQSQLKFVPIAIICIISFLIMASRNYVGCHSPLQIFVGGLVGIIIGITGYILYSYSLIWLGLPAESSSYMTYLYFSAGFLAALMIFGCYSLHLNSL